MVSAENRKRRQRPLHGLTFIFLLAVLARQASALDGPLIDVVVTSNLEASEKYNKTFIELLRSEVVNAGRKCFPTEQIARRKLADGEAPFRIEMDHQTQIVFGKSFVAESGYHLVSTKSERNSRGDLITTKTYDKNRYETDFYLKMREKGTVEVRLLKWAAGKYQLVKKWKAALKLTADGEPDEMVHVAELTQNASKNPLNLKPKCPISLAEAKAAVMDSLLPDPCGCDAMLLSLVQVRPGRIGRNTNGEIPFEVSVQNRSPWSVKAIDVTITTRAAVVKGTVELDTPVAPGKNSKVAGSGRSGSLIAKARPSAKLEGVEYIYNSK